MPQVNPLLARLQGEIVSIDPTRADWVETCFRSIASHKHAEEMSIESDNMATSDDDGFWPPKDDWRANYRPYRVKMGVLQIPIMGVLLNRFPWQLGHWATGYTYIQKAVERGMADPEVRKIAFVCDSPGGECSGNFELVDRIYAFRGQKPMRAFAADRAYSAAYCIASVADFITMTRTGGVGSIGVYTMHIDYSDMLANAGIRVTFIKAGERKTDGNPYERLSTRAKARTQVRIDRLMDMFVNTVVRNRGLEEKTIRDTEADCFGPEEAIEIGLADQVEVFEDALVAFTEDGTSGSGEDDNMTTQNAQAGAGTAKVLTQADVDAAVAAAVAQNSAQVQADAAAAATAAAKTRMSGILGCEPAKTRPKAALGVVQNSDMTVEQATAFLASLPEEQAVVTAPQNQAAPKAGATGALFKAAMDGGQHPDVGSGDAAAAGAGGGQGNSDEELAASILKDHAAATGFVPVSQQQKQRAA